MKRVLAVLILGTLTTQAGLVYFQLSPAGTDVAVGLSPSNEVPAVVNSTGSGNIISGGVVFDTSTMVLQVAIGYGSAAGFTDLTGAATAMHIHGPAAVGQAASPLVDLMPHNFPAADPAKGGIIYGNLALAPDVASNLLAGFTFVNIHTVLNPNGEIRGQLVPSVVSNSPPMLTCSPDATVECGTPALLTTQVLDPDGDAVTLTWAVNGVVVQSNSLPAQTTPAAVSVSFSSTLPLGTNVVVVTATDSATNTTSCATIVTVVDTTPPVITSVSTQPKSLWPPNHKMINVKVNANVTDTCSSTTWSIVSVTSNEAVNAKGSGNTGPDWIITGPHTVQLRAERAGPGSGRVYTITVNATDTSGNVSSNAVVKVTVPHDQGKGK